MKEENIKKSLLICNEVTNVTMPTARKAGSITITFNYPRYLECSKLESERLMELLMVNLMGGMATPIRGLSLEWYENVKDASLIK